ncbi:MAG: Arm DNA-binding domain-containing protein [Spirulina sp.]
MFSKTPTGKASKGSVAILVSHGRLQLRFRHQGKRHYLSLGFADTPANRKLAEMKAKEIELDILSGHFDETLTRYKPPKAAQQRSQRRLHPRLHPRFRRFGSSTPPTKPLALKKRLNSTIFLSSAGLLLSLGHPRSQAL